MSESVKHGRWQYAEDRGAFTRFCTKCGRVEVQHNRGDGCTHLAWDLARTPNPGDGSCTVPPPADETETVARLRIIRDWIDDCDTGSRVGALVARLDIYDPDWRTR